MEVRSWKRYGKHRLYVVDGDVDLGYFDVVAMAARPTAPEHLGRLIEAARVFGADTSRLGHAFPARLVGEETLPWVPTSAPPPVVVTEPAAEASATTESQPRRSLRDNVPGQSLQPKIEAAHAADQRPTLLRKLFLGKDAYSTWERGARGERLVAEMMQRFLDRNPEWTMLHSVPVGDRDADIDHVLVGPGGVFALNSKYHPDASIWVRGDTVKINGQNHPYVRNSRHEAARAARLLSAAVGFDVVVQGVVVVVRPERLKVVEMPADVVVVHRGQLRKLVERSPRTLSNEAVAAILAAAENPETWKPGPSPHTCRSATATPTA